MTPFIFHNMGFIMGLDCFDLDPVKVITITYQQVGFHIMVNDRSKYFPAIKSKPTGGKSLKRNLFVMLKCGIDKDLCVRAGFPLRYNPQFNITIQPCGWYLIEKAASPAISLKVSCINSIIRL